MKSIKIVSVGKLKKPFWVEAAGHYLTGLSRLIPVACFTVKDAPGHLPVEQRKKTESDALLTKTEASDRLIILDTNGRSLSSEQLSKQLIRWIDDPQKRPCFILGGAFGLSESAKKQADCLLSLGPMTLPHELAHVVLLEQLYRAMTILSGFPYHH